MSSTVVLRQQIEFPAQSYIVGQFLISLTVKSFCCYLLRFSFSSISPSYRKLPCAAAKSSSSSWKHSSLHMQAYAFPHHPCTSTPPSQMSMYWVFMSSLLSDTPRTFSCALFTPSFSTPFSKGSTRSAAYCDCRSLLKTSWIYKKLTSAGFCWGLWCATTNSFFVFMIQCFWT